MTTHTIRVVAAVVVDGNRRLICLRHHVGSSDAFIPLGDAHASGVAESCCTVCFGAAARTSHRARADRTRYRHRARVGCRRRRSAPAWSSRQVPTPASPSQWIARPRNCRRWTIDDFRTQVTRATGSLAYYLPPDAKLQFSTGISGRDGLGDSNSGHYQITNDLYSHQQLMNSTPRWTAQAYFTHSNSGDMYQLYAAVRT